MTHMTHTTLAWLCHTKTADDYQNVINAFRFNPAFPLTSATEKTRYKVELGLAVHLN